MGKIKNVAIVATMIQAVIVIGVVVFIFKVLFNGGEIVSDVLDEMEIEQVQEFPDGSTVYLKTDSIKGSVGSFFLGVYTINYVDAVGVLHTTTVKASSIHPTREVGGPVVTFDSDEPVDTQESDSIVEPYEVW
jgi:hypothetical protein